MMLAVELNVIGERLLKLEAERRLRTRRKKHSQSSPELVPGLEIIILKCPLIKAADDESERILALEQVYFPDELVDAAVERDAVIPFSDPYCYHR